MGPRPTSALRRLILASVIGGLAGLWTWTLPANPDLWPGVEAEDDVIVHILDNGFHTDLVAPRAALLERPGPLATATGRLAPGEWVRIGWGDARFYVDTSPIGSRLPDGARAFFRPGNASVVMLDPDDRDPVRASERRLTLRLSRPAFEGMRARIESSLDPRVVVAARRSREDAVFYRSRETFWIGHLCNHWTSEVLAAAGLQIRPFRALTSAEVMRTTPPGARPAHSADGR